MSSVRIDIYEGRAISPVITHICYGETLDEAWGIVDAHMKYDQFFRAAMTGRNFNGIELFADIKESEV